MEIFSVAALLIHPDGDVLSISRRDDFENIGLVGGKVDPGEMPVIALIREVREEIGVDVLEKDVEAIYDRPDVPGKVCRCFRVHAWIGRPRAMERGFKVRWVSLARMLEPGGTFTEYNRALFKHLGLIPDAAH